MSNAGVKKVVSSLIMSSKLMVLAVAIVSLLSTHRGILAQEGSTDKLAQQAEIGLMRIQRKEIWGKQDAIFLKWPAYDSVKEGLKQRGKKEYPTITESSIAEEILPRAKELNQKFWDAGHLESSASYEHNYEARALLEVAVEAYPQNEELINQLAEVIMSAEPTSFADFQPRIHVHQMLATLRKQQFETIIKKKSKEDIGWMDFAIAYDLLQLWSRDARDERNREYRIEVINWLINTVKDKGWTVYRDHLDKYQTVLKEGRRIGMRMNISIIRTAFQEQVRYGRRPASFQGPAIRAKNIVPLHEIPPARLVRKTGRGTFSVDEKGELKSVNLSEE